MAAADLTDTQCDTLTGRSLGPERVSFVLLSFEGPDRYARAGGLGVRMTELARALTEQGYPVDHLFVGDPAAPGREKRLDGRLTLHRWCQWISAYYPGGVYDGEEDKLRDFSASAPWFVADSLVRSAVEAGRLVVVMAEEWQTAAPICQVADLLRGLGIRDKAILLWNANNTVGFNRIDWARLAAASTITTVSRYMKQIMWGYGVNPLVIPNGIPRRLLQPVEEAPAARLRRSVDADTVLFKVARWDPDKRWNMTLETVARLKARGRRAVLVARGGVEAHGSEVLERAGSLGLEVHAVAFEAPCVDAYARALADAGPADVLNVTSPIPAEMLRFLYRGASAVLANSGHEPFGLVGLETMAAGGAAYTGHTGEEYVNHLHNAVVLETEDPEEAAWYLEYLAEHPQDEQRIREGARQTARQFVWERVIENLLGKVEFLTARQGSGQQPASPSPDPETWGMHDPAPRAEASLIGTS